MFVQSESNSQIKKLRTTGMLLYLMIFYLPVCFGFQSQPLWCVSTCIVPLHAIISELHREKILLRKLASIPLKFRRDTVEVIIPHISRAVLYEITTIRLGYDSQVLRKLSSENAHKT